MWTRNCPKCGIEISHTNKYNRDRLERRGILCRTCGTQKMSDGKKGKPIEHLKTHYERTRNLGPFVRNCPNCQKELVYKSQWSRQRGNRDNALCDSCATILYKKSWTHVIKDEHIKQMSATKAGYDSFDEYMADLDKKKKYRREVITVTRQQNISSLPNGDKLRGMCGVDGAYQLDHIISIDEGYRKGIEAAKIGHISNLQIIPWKENLLKSNGV